MPIEIKELNIKATVQNDCGTKEDCGPKNQSSNTPSDSQVNSIVAQCVEQVLNILKEKQER